MTLSMANNAAFVETLQIAWEIALSGAFAPIRVTFTSATGSAFERRKATRASPLMEAVSGYFGSGPASSFDRDSTQTNKESGHSMSRSISSSVSSRWKVSPSVRITLSSSQVQVVYLVSASSTTTGAIETLILVRNSPQCHIMQSSRMLLLYADIYIRIGFKKIVFITSLTLLPLKNIFF